MPQGVTRRRDGRWLARVQVAGRRLVAYRKTESEAEVQLERLKRKAAGGAGAATPPEILSDLLRVWLAERGSAWRPATLAGHRKVVDHDLLPALGHLRLESVTPEAAERICGRLRLEGKARTALKAFRALSACFALAANSCDQLEAPHYQPCRRDVWRVDELRALLAGTCDHPLHTLWLVAVSSGCRLGEHLALGWADVDLSRGTIRIDKARQRVAGEVVTRRPKTAASYRTIALPAEAAGELRSLARDRGAGTAACSRRHLPRLRGPCGPNVRAWACRR